MRKEQLLLLALLAVLFGPTSSLQDPFEDDEIDDECHVKTSIVLKKLDTCDSQKIKDDFRRNQLWTDVVKETMGAMMRELREDIKSQSYQATEKLENKIEDGMKSNLEMKSRIDRTLLSVEANKKQMEDLMMKVQSIKDCQRTLATWSLNERNATLFFKAMGRTFYYNETQRVTWYETRDWCSSRGMQMATLKTADELKQVENILRSQTSITKLFWVSASDIGRSSGQFHWPDGAPVLNSTWYSGEPDSHHANQETCALIITGSEKLYDAPCSDSWSTLCEVPELLATCL